jgi:hypothetical protein
MKLQSNWETESEVELWRWALNSSRIVQSEYNINRSTVSTKCCPQNTLSVLLYTESQNFLGDNVGPVGVFKKYCQSRRTAVSIARRGQNDVREMEVCGERWSCIPKECPNRCRYKGTIIMIVVGYCYCYCLCCRCGIVVGSG